MERSRHNQHCYNHLQNTSEISIQEHLSTQLYLVFRLVKIVPHLWNADVNSCILASGVWKHSKHLMSWRKLMRGLAAASLSTDEDTKWSSLSSESNCEAKLNSQTAFEGIEISSIFTLEASIICYSHWLFFLICESTITATIIISN